MFEGHYDPIIHLQRYHLEAISFENDDDILVKLFPLSSKSSSFSWFTNFPNESITYFYDVVKDFLD